MDNNTAGIFLKSNSDFNPNKYLFVYQRYYPGQKSYSNNKSFSYLLKDILTRLDLLNSKYTDEFRHILDKLNSSSLRNSGKDIDTDYTNVIVKPFLIMFQQNGIDINFICKSYGFSYVISIPKGSPEGSEGPKATAIREFREEIGEDITEKMEKLSIIGECGY